MSNFIKKLIYIIGLVLVTLIFVLNIINTSTMQENEVVRYRKNTLLFLIVAILLSILIFYICKELKEKSNEIKKKYLIFGLVIFLYVTIQIVIIYYKSTPPRADQSTAYKLAIAMKEGNVQEFLENTYTYEGSLRDDIYVERYQQQFTLAFIWSILFRLLNTTSYKVIEYLNVICNSITLISVFLICKELSQKYNVNKYLGITLIATFWSIPVLSTFIYGDFSSMGLALLGTYFVMRYCSQRKLKYIIYFIACISIAYLLRMNTLIFFLAILIYLFLDLLKNNENKKAILSKVAVIVCFIIFTLLPADIIKSYYLNKANLDKDKSFPVLGYVYMGMTVSKYGPGWYTYEYANIAYHNIEDANGIYVNLIKERLNYFKENPSYACKFYLLKILSMWTENSHSSIREKILVDENGNYIKDMASQGLHDAWDILILHQKALMLIIFGCTMIILVQNRKNLSNEIILLLAIFIGGFLFHLIWEAKSRYILPYIVVLMPIATIEITKFNFKKKSVHEKNKKI